MSNGTFSYKTKQAYRETLAALTETELALLLDATKHEFADVWQHPSPLYAAIHADVLRMQIEQIQFEQESRHE